MNRSTRFHCAVAALLAALVSPSAMAACYVVYGPDADIVYRAPVPPVDLSLQLHETLPLVAPGATMVFSLDNHGCELAINKLPLASASVGAGAPGAAFEQGARRGRADRG